MLISAHIITLTSVVGYALHNGEDRTSDNQDMWQILLEGEDCQRALMRQIPPMIKWETLKGNVMYTARGCQTRDNCQLMMEEKSEEFIREKDTQCADKTKSDISERSFCPWYNIETINPDRFPEHLRETRCCFDMRAEYNVTCEEITYVIPILVREKNAKNDFVKKLYTLPVGCTSAKAVRVAEGTDEGGEKGNIGSDSDNVKDASDKTDDGTIQTTPDGGHHIDVDQTEDIKASLLTHLQSEGTARVTETTHAYHASDENDRITEESDNGEFTAKSNDSNISHNETVNDPSTNSTSPKISGKSVSTMTLNTSYYVEATDRVDDVMVGTTIPSLPRVSNSREEDTGNGSTTSSILDEHTSEKDYVETIYIDDNTTATYKQLISKASESLEYLDEDQGNSIIDRKSTVPGEIMTTEMSKVFSTYSDRNTSDGTTGVNFKNAAFDSDNDTVDVDDVFHSNVTVELGKTTTKITWLTEDNNNDSYTPNSTGNDTGMTFETNTQNQKGNNTGKTLETYTQNPIGNKTNANLETEEAEVGSGDLSGDMIDDIGSGDEAKTDVNEEGLGEILDTASGGGTEGKSKDTLDPYDDIPISAYKTTGIYLYSGDDRQYYDVDFSFDDTTSDTNSETESRGSGHAPGVDNMEFSGSGSSPGVGDMEFSESGYASGVDDTEFSPSGDASGVGDLELNSSRSSPGASDRTLDVSEDYEEENSTLTKSDIHSSNDTSSDTTGDTSEEHPGDSLYNTLNSTGHFFNNSGGLQYNSSSDFLAGNASNLDYFSNVTTLLHSLPDTTTDFSDRVLSTTPGDETSHDTTEVVQEVTNAADDHI